MLENKVMHEAKSMMQKCVDHLHEEMGSIRTNKANTGMVDNVLVDYYGNLTKLRELAGITTPDPRLIVIQPWDPNIIEAVEKALSKSELGLTPHVDGKIIRVSVPELSEERRNNLKKILKQLVEEARVALRNIRRDANEEIRKGEKESQITEDDRYRIEKEVQHKTDEFIKKVEELLHQKEKEIMTV